MLQLHLPQQHHPQWVRAAQDHPKPSKKPQNPSSQPYPRETETARSLSQPGLRPARLVPPTASQQLPQSNKNTGKQQLPGSDTDTHDPRARVYSRGKTTGRERPHQPKTLPGRGRASNNSILPWQVKGRAPCGKSQGKEGQNCRKRAMETTVNSLGCSCPAPGGSTTETPRNGED